MTGLYRLLLEHVAPVANLRALVATRRDHLALVSAFRSCLAALRELRDNTSRSCRGISSMSLTRARPSRSLVLS